MTPSISNDEVMAQLGKAIPVLEQNLGTGVFITNETRQVPRLTSGIAVVDHILGGGIPVPSIVEVFGPESVGKTTWAAQFMAASQRNDVNSRWLYLDYEQTMTRDYLEALGALVDMPRLLFSQPMTIEEGTMLAKLAMTRGWINGIIWDTPAASQPASMINTPLSDKELKAGYKDLNAGKHDTGQIGLHSRVFSHSLASLAPIASQSGTIMVFPNQIRTTINTWGAGETTPGGRALKFYASIRIRMSKAETTKESVEDPILGIKQATAVENVIQFHAVKNKTAPPFRLTKVRLGYGRGFLDKETLIDLAIKRKVGVQKNGSFFQVDGHNGSIRGWDALYDYFDDPNRFAALRGQVMETGITDDEKATYVDAETQGAELTEDGEPARTSMSTEAMESGVEADEDLDLAEGITRF